MGSPEELIGIALAGCFSMSLADRLVEAGAAPRRIETAAQVQLSVSPDESIITGIALTCRAQVDDVDGARFRQLADVTRESCVVARALAAIPVSLTATLV
jgi:osmotically inducible protein OsmC